jgi:soluble cytochrome b562
MLLDNSTFKPLWHDFYYDGIPFSGLGTYNGEKVYFNIHNDRYEWDKIPEITKYFNDNAQSIIENNIEFKEFQIGMYHLIFELDVEEDMREEEESIMEEIKNKIISKDYTLQNLINEFAEKDIYIMPIINEFYELYRVPNDILVELEAKHEFYRECVGHQCDYGSKYKPYSNNHNPRFQEYYNKYQNHRINMNDLELMGFINADYNMFVRDRSSTWLTNIKPKNLIFLGVTGALFMMLCKN